MSISGAFQNLKSLFLQNSEPNFFLQPSRLIDVKILMFTHTGLSFYMNLLL